jgi:hypothetical protein
MSVQREIISEHTGGFAGRKPGHNHDITPQGGEFIDD